jgi:hypothetical protein
LQIHAGLSPVTVVALAGNSPDIIWKDYVREFERSKTTRLVALEDAIRVARREVARDGENRCTRASFVRRKLLGLDSNQQPFD